MSSYSLRIQTSTLNLDVGHVQRLQFSEHILSILQDDLAVIITSDEANFHLNGQVNKLNCQYWAEENTRELHQKSLHNQMVIV